jgi:hypothetical protein
MTDIISARKTTPSAMTAAPNGDGDDPESFRVCENSTLDGTDGR